jgi:hypothetical protein
MGNTKDEQVKGVDSIYANETLETVVQFGMKHCLPARADHEVKVCRDFGYAVVGGMYSEGLRLWSTAFPTSTIVVTSLAEFTANTATVIQTVADAVGLPCAACSGGGGAGIAASKSNVDPNASGAKSKSERNARAQLQRFYSQWNKSLWKLVARLRESGQIVWAGKENPPTE